MKATGRRLCLLASLCWLGWAGPFASARTVVLEGGSYLDPAGTMRPFAAIVLEDDRIKAVVAPGESWEAPPAAERVDVRGRYVIPGLIDGHVHLVHILFSLQISAEELFPLFLAHGVTTVRDTGDEITTQQKLADYAQRHPELAPRVFLGSPLVDGNPAYHPYVSWPMTDPADVPAFVEKMSAVGVQTFKLYVGTSRAVGQALVRETQRHGRWATAHLAWGYTAQEAAADGINSLEHIGSVYEFILPPGTPRWPPPAERSKLAPDQLAALESAVLAAKAKVDVDGPEARDLIDSLVRHHVAVNPTLVVYRNWMLLRDLESVQTHPDLAGVPARLREGWQHTAQAAQLDPATRELRAAQFERMKQLTLRLHRAGVELMAGSDTPVQFCPPGGALLQELELLTEAGLTPAETLRAATRNNARALGQSAELGSIEVGKIADLVILSSDPLADIRHTRDIHRVIHAGRVLDPAELLRQVPVR
jgi:hypothetical protein